jgi:hypothetical protein
MPSATAARQRATKAELQWRLWFLGEGPYRDDAKNPARRAETGAPARIPKEWWQRLEAFLAKRSDYSEPGRKPGPEKPPVVQVPGQLSPHFHVREFACKDGRQVPDLALPALKRLVVDYLEPMRAAFGPCHVLSGYRPADYNRRIGGATFSQHIYELTPTSVAADLTFRTGNPAAWARFAEQLGAGGVGRYDRSGFVHVDNRPDRARWTG